ncbi:MAG: hypothetical protein ACYDBB_09385 [Armatimonadota bacterium]
MAQAALHKIWLDPEPENEQITLQPRSRQRRQPAVASLRRPLGAVIVVACAVLVVMAYIYSYARIAQYDLERQALQQEYAQLSRECVALNLDIDRLAVQPRLMQAAQAQGLELPTTDRVHYVRVVNDLPPSTMTAAGPATAPRSWVARSGQQLVAALDSAWQRLSRGPGLPSAYAQE